MTREKAKKTIQSLREEFDARFAIDVLDEPHIRSPWLDKCTRLVADSFGVHDNLYIQITDLAKLSGEYEQERGPITRMAMGEKWHRLTSDWLARMDTQIGQSTGFDANKLIDRSWFKLLYPIIVAVIVAVIAAYVNYLYAQQLAQEQRDYIESQEAAAKKANLASTLAEFEYWSKGLQNGLVDSVELINADFAARGVYLSGAHFHVLHNFAKRRRFSMDSTRCSLFARIAALGGDTLMLDAPRKLDGVVVERLRNLAEQLQMDEQQIRRLRLDTL